MLSPKFYSQISVCSNCQGWGTKNFASHKDTDPCLECGGTGVFLSQPGYIYIWDAPTFVDYKSRRRALLFKIVAVILILTCLYIVYSLVRGFIL
jgi:hypothetical protein